MDRLPLPPPFEAGARLRYLGSDDVASGGAPVKRKGLEVIIELTRLGTRGTGRQAPGCEQGALDRTSDGRSVYRVNGKLWCIYPKDAKDWEVLPPLRRYLVRVAVTKVYELSIDAPESGQAEKTATALLERNPRAPERVMALVDTVIGKPTATIR